MLPFRIVTLNQPPLWKGNVQEARKDKIKDGHLSGDYQHPDRELAQGYPSPRVERNHLILLYGAWNQMIKAPLGKYDRKLLFEPAEALTLESGRCQTFFLFLIRD